VIGLIVLVEVVLRTWLDIFKVDLDVSVAILTRLLVPEAKRMTQLPVPGLLTANRSASGPAISNLAFKIERRAKADDESLHIQTQQLNYECFCPVRPRLQPREHHAQPAQAG
jgi:hypothetical protein